MLVVSLRDSRYILVRHVKRNRLRRHPTQPDMITPSSKLPYISPIEISSGDSNSPPEQSWTPKTSQSAPHRLQNIGPAIALRNGETSRMRRRPLRVDVNAPLRPEYRDADSELDYLASSPKPEEPPVRYTEEQIRSMYRRILRQMGGSRLWRPQSGKNMPAQPGIGAREREVIYAQYMAGHFNGRLNQNALKDLCVFLRHAGMLVPFQYIPEADREFVQNRMSLADGERLGVGTLRNRAIQEYDRFRDKVAGIHRNPLADDASAESARRLRNSMSAELDPNALVRAAGTGKVNRLIRLLSMKDAGGRSALPWEARVHAIMTALNGGHDSIAMHLLMHLQNSSLSAIPKNLTGLLQDMLDLPFPHPDLLWKLIELGADPNAQGKGSKDTALHVACRNDHGRFRDFLLTEKRVRRDILNASGHRAEDVLPHPGGQGRRQPVRFTFVRSQVSDLPHIPSP
jgi:hypothetical protein